MPDETGFDRFDLQGPWRTAAAEIIRTLRHGSGSSSGRELREGVTSDLPLERLARAYCANNPRVELPLVYGVLSVAVCIAAQGAFTLYCPLAGGGWLKVPAIQHFIGVTPSGGRKSTTLDVGRTPLKAALAEGMAVRAEKAKREMDRELNLVASTNPQGLDTQQFEMVYSAARCSSTIVKDPTVEALRDMVVNNGGIAGVVSAEADAFRNLTAYNSDGGSLTFFLDLWDQADVQTARVSKGTMQMNDAALPSCVLLQTDVFAEVTAGSSQRMSVTSDSFVTRGMFGRAWVAEALTRTGHEDVADAYTDEGDFEFGDNDGMHHPDGTLTSYGEVVAHFSGALRWIVDQTNDYRMGKALHQAWQQAYAKYGFNLLVPEQPEPGRIVLKLDAEARKAYRRVQRMQAAVETVLQDMSDDTQVIWAPLASRITQHVMREALVLSLAAGSTNVRAEIIEDAATRLLPWRLHLSVHALGRRETDRMEMIVANSVRENPQGRDLSVDAMVVKAIGLLMTDASAVANGVGSEQIIQKVRNMLPPKQRAGIEKVVEAALLRIRNDVNSGIGVVHGTNAEGRSVERFKATLPSSNSKSPPDPFG